MAGLKESDLDQIILSSCTPDYLVPPTSTLIQEKLGIAEVATMDVRSACSGSMQALIAGVQFIKSGHHRTIAVVGTDLPSMFGNLDRDSKYFSRQDLVNAVMLGDASAAVILQGFDPVSLRKSLPTCESPIDG